MQQKQRRISKKERYAFLLILLQAAIGKMSIKEGKKKYKLSDARYKKIQQEIKEDPTMYEQKIILVISKFIKQKDLMLTKHLVDLKDRYKQEK